MLTQLDLDFFMLSFFRALGFLTLLPFGSTIIGNTQRIIFAFGLAILLVGHGHAASDCSFFHIAAEFLLGTIIGLPLALLVSCAEMYGAFFDTGRGQAISNMYDPVSGVQSTIMATFMRSYLWVSLLLLGVLDILLLAYAKSFSFFKAGDYSALFSQKIASSLLSLIAEYLSAFMLYFLPFALLFLLVDLSIGVISKALPRVMLHGEAFQIKTYLGLLLLAVMHQFDIAVGLLDYACLGWLR